MGRPPSSPYGPSYLSTRGSTILGHRRLLATALSIVCTIAMAGCATIDGANIQVLSSSPRMVSEGSALVSITLADGAQPSNLRVTVGERDVTSGFDAQESRLVGLLTGLQLGANTVTAESNGREIGSLVLMNHDRNGPIISGPQQHPFYCQTEDFRLPDGSNLGRAQDEFCNAPTRVMYLYKSTSGGPLRVLSTADALPADLAQTTTSDGRTVPFIVRLETGTINRSIYQSAVLFDPTREGEPTPLRTHNGWNRKIVYAFGGGAGAGYRQGAWAGMLAGPVVDNERFLAQGFAVLGASLNVFQVTSNDVLSAETASMVKERFIETFGEPLYTIGWGGSGGAMQQFLIANAYPGILDGITPAASFADLQTLAMGVDCALLERAFASSGEWTDAQKTAVAGWNMWDTCASWGATYSPYLMRAERGDRMVIRLPNGGRFDVNNCGQDLPAQPLYDSETNRSGARCDMYTAIVNIVGIDPATGFAARAFDNVGVQYGLNAFRDGVISAEQFVALNEQVGGFDADGNFQRDRTVASLQALNAVFATGRVNEATNLDQIPIIDHRYVPVAIPDVHDAVRSLSLRERLIRAHGDAGNQVIIRYAAASVAAGSGEVSASGVEDFIVQKMDEWLMNIRRDTRRYGSSAARVAANRPSDLTDTCFLSSTERVAEQADANNGGRCGEAMPYFRNTRMAAGGPLSDDVLKCQLKPLTMSDYRGLSPAQFSRLQAVFSLGVCDYTRPSVGFQPLQSGWLSFADPGHPEPLH